MARRQTLDYVCGVIRSVICSTAIATVVLAASLAGATSPRDRQTNRYADGLTIRQVGETRAGDVVMLRPAPAGRIHIAGGTFTMGASPMAMLYGLQLCKREPLGNVLLPIELRTGHVDHQSMHCDVHRFESEGAAHAVTLSPFWMDRTEVRVADYQRCAATGACNAPGFSPGDARFSQPDFPIVLVSWDDARAYCSFAKGRLPTEAEWELAARGLEGRTFPWGNVYNAHLSNHGSIALDPTDATDGFAGLAPVGSIPDGKTPLGLLDMAGNAAEWVADAYEADSVGEVPIYPPAPVTNPRSDVGARRVVRGGSYMQGADAQRTTARLMTYPTRRLPYVGFRCAQDG